MGAALFTEFAAVMSRDELFEDCPASPEERQDLFQAFLSVCRWVNIFFLWRPNLPDEGDNHVLELAVAAGAKTIVTNNTRDFLRAELQFPDIEVLTPDEFLTRMSRYDDDDDQAGQ
jgi:predicted nucleic acid-binding protein